MHSGLENHIQQLFHDSLAAKRQALAELKTPLAETAITMAACLRGGHKFLSCGNGGSVGDAQHFSSEMVNRFERERPGLPAIALTTDTFALTSIANDYRFAEVFARQVRALGQEGDMLLAISTSGNSENIIQAVLAAREKNIRVVALNGRDGGQLSQMLGAEDFELRVSAQSTARIQEVHLLIIHCLCELIDHLMFDANG